MIPEDMYSQIVHLMPIPCVDVIPVNDRGRVLLMKRANEPARGQWWFPGGRVRFLELRAQAAMRKLKEECGLDGKQTFELGTYDVIVEISQEKGPSHGITTLYYIQIDEENSFTLDAQNSEADWRLPEEWLKLSLHSFIRQGLATYIRYRESGSGTMVVPRGRLPAGS